VPQILNPKGKGNEQIRLIDQIVVVGVEVDVAVVVEREGIVEIEMVTVKIVVNVAVAEVEENAEDVDVVADAVVLAADLVIITPVMSKMRTVVDSEDSEVDLVEMLVVTQVIPDSAVVVLAVVDLEVVVMTSKVEDVAEDAVGEDPHVVNVIVVTRKATLSEIVLSPHQKDQTTMHPLPLRILVDLVNRTQVALGVVLAVLKAKRVIDLLAEEDSVDEEGEEEEADVGDPVNLTGVAVTIKAVQLKHLTNVKDLERTIGEHLEMS